VKSVKAVTISNTELAAFSKVMVRGNRIAKRWAKKLYGNRKHKFMRTIIDGGKTDALTSQEVTQISEIPAADMEKIKAVSDIRNDVIVAFVPLVEKLSRRMGFNADLQDELFGEGMLKMIEIVNGYSDLSVKFITYAQCALQGHFLRIRKRFSRNTEVKASKRAKKISKKTKKRLEQQPSFIIQQATKLLKNEEINLNCVEDYRQPTEESDLAQRILDLLSGESKKAMEIWFQSLSYDTVAEEMGIQMPRAKALVAAGRKKLTQRKEKVLELAAA